MERTNGKKNTGFTILPEIMKEKNNCLYTRDDTGTLTGNGVQNFVPLCQRYKKNMAKRKKKIMQGYTAMAKDFIGWRLHNFAREKEKKMAKLKKINAFTV